jgi:rare lipoprotein A
MLSPTRALLLVLAAMLVAACSSSPRRAPAPIPPPEPQPVVPEAAPTPSKPDISKIPDAVPRVEPRSKRGNPPFYTVQGKRYAVLDSAEGYLERGIASWYGPTFHGELTSMGERYDMYAMSAAHKSLPLPAYARVTNLKNGRSVVVRINDRGPFIANRIIDLSYTAAARLDMLREGTSMVEVRALIPGQPDPLTRTSELPPQRLFVQAGAFADAKNAERLLDKLRAGGLSNVTLASRPDGQPPLYRVRLGPVGSVREFDSLVVRLNALGIRDARLATE